MTRWDGLFADLEAQAESLAAAELAAEVDDRIRGEAGDLRVVDRLRAAVGQPLTVSVAGGLWVAGSVRRVGSDWVLLAEGDREVLVSQAAVVSIRGLPRWSEVPGSEGAVGSRLGIRSVLRGLARDRVPLRVHLTDGMTFDATLDRVGADFVEIATHQPGEFRRRTEVRETVVVPVGALSALRRHTSD